MAKHRQPVGVGLFEKKDGLGLPNHPPAQSGTVNPTDKRSENLGSRAPKKGSNQRKYHGQQAK